MKTMQKSPGESDFFSNVSETDKNSIHLEFAIDLAAMCKQRTPLIWGCGQYLAGCNAQCPTNSIVLATPLETVPSLA